jgi:hypothetical protein
MIAMTKSLRPVAAVGIIAMLAACAGAGSPPTAGGLSSGMSPMGNFFSPDKCKKDHGVGVSPCKVTLTTSNPTQTVTVSSPSGSTIKLKDKHCSKKDIATVEGTGSTWDATAGTTMGMCLAVFTAKSAKGKKIGTATLTITNKA